MLPYGCPMLGIRAPEDVRQLYEVHDWRHAEALFANYLPEEFDKLCDARWTF